MSQQYSLRWNNHQPNFISMFTSLLNTQTLVDVTLAADGRQLLAHKVVLSACSTYFQSLFVDNPSPHPIVILKDVTYAELRTMVDFMYCGEVNVTEEQLPKVLDTAKLLKIKGLTEMPDSTSLTRSQGTSVDLQGDSDSQRQSPVPAAKRRRRRQSSSASYTQPLYVDESRVEMGSQPIEAVTLSSLPQQQQQQQQRRVREYNEIRTIDTAQQTNDQSHENIPMDDIHEVMDVPTPLPQALETVAAPTSPTSEGRNRRSKHFRRQQRVPEDPRGVRKQMSEPPIIMPKVIHTLQKHESYPQFSTKTLTRRPRTEQEVGSLLIRAVAITPTERQSSSTTGTSASASASFESTASESSTTPRASHTPAVRSGPPLSCNFCWNTVDECGRILRRKTQYHCPECRTNLCIVPCFHEYHEGPETDASANAR